MTDDNKVKFMSFAGPFCIGMLGGILLILPFSPNVWPEFALAHNMAHYDNKTGKYILDSLIVVNDSTIIVRKK